MTDTTKADVEALIERLEWIPVNWVDPRAGKEAAATLRALSDELDRVKQERDALASRFDPDHPDQALISRIIMRSIENEVRAEAAEAARSKADEAYLCAWNHRDAQRRRAEAAEAERDRLAERVSELEWIILRGRKEGSDA